MDWEAARISIWLALLTALLLIAPAVWLARWLAITPWRGRPLIEALLTLPLLLPPDGKPFGYMDSREWVEFGGFFADQGLISTRPTAAEMFTDDLLPGKVPE